MHSSALEARRCFAHVRQDALLKGERQAPHVGAAGTREQWPNDGYQVHREAASAVGLVNPVPGTGLALKAARAADKVGDVAKGLDHASDVAKGADNIPIPGKGTKVYRIYGEKNNPLGQSWTNVDPRRVENYRDSAGLPDVNSGRFVIEGRITNTIGITTRKALPLDGNNA